MNSHFSAPALTTLVLTLLAGTTAPVNAQSDAPARTTAAAGSTLDFRSCHWVSDRKVVNNDGTEIAEVSDLILNRGSGRIEYVVIKTGATFGLGGRAVAIPYGAFRWESAKDRFVLASTTEQLKQYPEYSGESWKAMKDLQKDDQSVLRQRLDADAAAAGDPYAGNLDNASKSRVEGEVTKVERVRTSTFGEQVVITVATADGSAKRIALGPSWYVNASPAAPLRGDKVVVDTLVLPRDPDQLLAGSELRSGNRELRLRNSDGSAAWSLKSVDASGHRYSTPYSRYLVLSHLQGMKIDCRGNELGKVHDVILDRNSGEIGFVSVDPNQNFLGVGDTKRLVPWSVATVTLDGVMRLDASKEMVLASPETPSDLATLNSGTHAERVYKAFNVPVPRFEAPTPVSAVPPDAGSAWSARGCIIGSIDRDSARTMKGEVTDVTEVKFERGVQSAQALKIRLAGDGAGSETVLLGPSWYMDNQKPGCHTGDLIKVDARRTTIEGRQYWIATSIECKDARVVLLDANYAPAWTQP